MKKMSIAVLLVMGLLSTGVRAAESPVAVTVKGMVCSFCAQGITKKFTARPEVSKVEVKLEDQKVHLTVKDGQTLSDDTIRTILTDAGYSIEKIERPTK